MLSATTQPTHLTLHGDEMDSSPINSILILDPNNLHLSGTLKVENDLKTY